MHTNHRFLNLACRAVACSVFLAGSTSLIFAQQAPSVESTLKLPTFVASEAAPLDLSLAASSSSSSSSSSDSLATDSVAKDRANLSSADAADALQPPPRRRYGRPNYSDSHTNPDGSSKFAFMAGAGASVPLQDTANYLTPNYAFQVGVGRNWSKKVGVMAQFDYDHFGFQGSTLYNQENLYNSYCTAAYQAAGECAPITSLDGTSHIWSFTLDPTFTFYGTDRSGAYVVAGLGFYHKTANFTVPATGEYCDPYYGCYEYTANESIDKYTSNAVGFNGGVGFTYKPSHFASERFYLEARYVFVDNSPKAATTTNLYPPNANQSYYIPVTFGLRF